MSIATPGRDTEQLLADLRGDDFRCRQRAARWFAAHHPQDEPTRAAVRQIAEKELDWSVRYQLLQALMPAKPAVVVPPERKALDFVIGFAGWWLINGALWWWIPKDPAGDYLILQILILPANLLVMGLLLLTRRWMGFAVLMTYAVNLAVGLVYGAANPFSACWIPFFIRAQ